MPKVMASRVRISLLVLSGVVLCWTPLAEAQRTTKPVLHGKHWVAIPGKPLGATAGATIFAQGGNAVDAACAMLGATSTMWDTLGWGGETQALIYNPRTGEVQGINALGVAPTGAFSRSEPAPSARPGSSGWFRAPTSDRPRTRVELGFRRGAGR